jgi:hypothetical protein
VFVFLFALNFFTYLKCLNARNAEVLSTFSLGIPCISYRKEEESMTSYSSMKMASEAKQTEEKKQMDRRKAL